MSTLELISCPEPSCQATAEILDRFLLGSTSGPVEHAKTYCVHRHFFVLPTGHPWLVCDARSRDAAPSRTNRLVTP
jgi:hypothetical protein